MREKVDLVIFWVWATEKDLVITASCMCFQAHTNHVSDGVGLVKPRDNFLLEDFS